MTTETIYSPRPGAGKIDMLRRITDACRHGNVEPPTLHGEVSAVLDAEATADTVALTIAVEAVDADDAAAFVDDAVARMTRAVAVDAVRRGLVTGNDRVLRQVGGRTRQVAVDRLAPVVAATLEALAGAARKLPDEPLDLDAVVATDATKPWKAAQAALADLAAYRPVYDLGDVGSLGPKLASILPFVEVAAVELEEVDRMSSRSLSAPSAERDGIRAFHRALDELGCDEGLVRAARGEYAGVSLAWADSSAEVTARAERADRALSRRRVDSWGREPVVVPKRPAIVVQ